MGRDGFRVRAASSFRQSTTYLSACYCGRGGEFSNTPLAICRLAHEAFAFSTVELSSLCYIARKTPALDSLHYTNPAS